MIQMWIITKFKAMNWKPFNRLSQPIIRSQRRDGILPNILVVIFAIEIYLKAASLAHFWQIF